MVGGGAMGGAIVEGILGGVPDSQVTVVEANDERAEMWRRRGDVRVADLTEAVSDADVIFLAVKPDQITDVLGQAAESVNPNGVVVSIAAGVPVTVLERHAPDGVAVVAPKVSWVIEVLAPIPVSLSRRLPVTISRSVAAWVPAARPDS